MLTMATSRFLQRNGWGFENEEVGDTECLPLPQQISDPCNPCWQYPHWVTTPWLFGCYVQSLHRCKAINSSFDRGMYAKWASKMRKSNSWERLCRAACLAANRAQHSFSTKFIEKVLVDVPESPKFAIVQELF